MRKAEEALQAARAKLRGHKNHPGGNGKARTLTAPSSQSRRPGGLAQTATLDAARAHQNEVLARYDVRLGDVRTWANENSVDCPQGGSRLPRTVLDAYTQAHPVDEVQVS